MPAGNQFEHIRKACRHLRLFSMLYTGARAAMQVMPGNADGDAVVMQNITRR
jgi:hypothetical protein